jgi:hypothetical protein
VTDADGSAEGYTDASMTEFHRWVWGEICEDEECEDWSTHPTPDWMMGVVLMLSDEIQAVLHAEDIVMQYGITSYDDDETN